MKRYITNGQSRNLNKFITPTPTPTPPEEKGTSEYHDLPEDGMEPNVVYALGELTGEVTITLATGQEGKVNHYFFTFEIGAVLPTINWPAEILAWKDDEEPDLTINTHYEVSILDGVAVFISSPSVINQGD